MTVKGKTLDKTTALVVVMDMREQLICEIETAIDRRQSGNAAWALQALRGFDSLAERLGYLDNREWERNELSKRIVSILSLP